MSSRDNTPPPYLIEVGSLEPTKHISISIKKGGGLYLSSPHLIDDNGKPQPQVTSVVSTLTDKGIFGFFYPASLSLEDARPLSEDFCNSLLRHNHLTLTDSSLRDIPYNPKG